MIPLVDLKPQTQQLKKRILHRFERIFANTEFINGRDVKEFESAFAEYLGVKHVISAGNGTDALTIILKSLEVEKGASILLPVNTFIATAEAIVNAGYTPRFCDVCEGDHLMDLDTVAEQITPDTKAIMPVHLYGQMVDMEKVFALAKRHELVVIEDAAQAHGARWNGDAPGRYSLAAGYSFYPGKNLGAFGDAGCIATNSDMIYERTKKLKDHGQESKYHHTMVGTNSRMDTLQAAVLLEKLVELDTYNSKRRDLARRYSMLLAEIEDVQIPQENTGADHVFHLYVIKTANRDKLLDFLKHRDIFCGIHYPVPLHLDRAFGYLSHDSGQFPVAEKLAQQILSLPLYPEMSYAAQDKVVAAVRDFYHSQ